MAERDGYIKTGVDVDDASFVRLATRYRGAIKSVADMRKEVTQMGSAAKSAGLAVAQGADQAAKSIDKAEKSTAKWVQRLDEVAKKRLRGTLPSQQQGLDDLRGGLMGGGSGGGRFGSALGLLGPGVSTIKGLQSGDAGQAALGVARLAPGITELVGGVGKLAVLAPVAALSVAGIALALDNFNKQTEPGRKALERATASVEAYYDAIEAGTTESIDAQLKSLKRRNELELEELKLLENARSKAFGEAQKQVGDLGARLGFAVGGATGQFTALDERIAALKKSTTDAQGSIDGLTRAQSSNAVAANDLLIAEEKLAEERKLAANEGIARETEARRLLRTATSEQVKELIASGNDEIAAIEKQMEAVKANGLVQTSQLKLYDELNERLEKVKVKNKEYADSILPIIEATEKAKAAFKKLFSGDIIPPEAKKAWEDLSERVKQATAEAVARDKALVQTQAKYEDDVTRLQESGQQRRAEIAGQFNDKLIDIAREAADGAAKALRDLQQKRSDLALQFTRDDEKAQRDAAMSEIDIRIGAAREEEKSFRDHLRNLEKIRADAQDREFELIMNRDFAGLFFSRRQTGRQLTDASQSFSSERQERQIGTRDQIDDLRRSIQNERNERIIAYNQSLQDAQIAYTRQRQEDNRQRQIAIREAQIARNRELQSLTQSINAQLQARYRGYREELRLATLTVQARIDLENAILQRAKKAAAEAQPTVKRVGGGTPTFRAVGGPLQAGQLAIVNEPGSSGRETFTSAGQTVDLPGMGAFLPSRAGTVNANRQTVNLGGLTFNITGGNNPEATARAIKPMVYDVLKEIVG